MKEAVFYWPSVIIYVTASALGSPIKVLFSKPHPAVHGPEAVHGPKAVHDPEATLIIKNEFA